MCNRTWLVTDVDDCMMPACGCYGTDSSEANPARPCERCAVAHTWTCPYIQHVGEDSLNGRLVEDAVADVDSYQEGTP